MEIGEEIRSTSGKNPNWFKIERELGSGAMGTVYRAQHYYEDELKGTLAIKFISYGLTANESAMARFTREAKILEQLRHKNIVKLFGHGKYKKTPYIAMEFIDGEPLDRILERRRKLGWEEVAGYMKQLCSALQCAHDNGIIHRDLKPSNLMITKDGTLKLTDFGIAKDVDVTALTGMNSTIGTAAYMSPEQCQGKKDISGKSDLYAMGIVMYELITGRKPFTAETTVDMFLKHVKEKPPRPTRFVPDLPVWLETLMLSLLAKNKDDRPLDAATVGKMIEEIEEKVAAQASAGVDAATARRIDRESGTIEDEDLDAARTLRDSKSKRKRKKKEEAKTGMPPWLKFLPPVFGLLAIAGLLYFLMRPDSLEKQFAKVENAANATEKVDAATKFLERNANHGGEYVDKARAILREAKGQKLDGILATRFRTQKLKTAQGNEDVACYDNSWKALEAEQKGDTVRAVEFWNKVKESSLAAKDEYGDGWAWLADSHIGEIRKADEHVKALQGELKNREIYDRDDKLDAGDPKNLAAAAIRFGALGGLKAAGADLRTIPFLKDDAKAAKCWNDLVDLTKDKSEFRSWHLLGARERRNYSELKPEQALPARKALIAAQLKTITDRWNAVKTAGNKAEQGECRVRVRELVELYADETDAEIQKLIAEAGRLFKTIVEVAPSPKT